MNLAMLDRVSVPYSNFDRFALDLYRKAVTVFYIEERMKVFAKQGKCSFVASSRGHIITQTGLASLLRPGHDWFFTYYRSKGTAIGLGLPLKDIFLGMLGRDGDPNSGGRNMPEHFSLRALNLVSRSACIGSQYLQAVGAASAIKNEGSDAIVCVESGGGRHKRGRVLRIAELGRERIVAGLLRDSEQRLCNQCSAADPDRFEHSAHRRRIWRQDIVPRWTVLRRDLRRI